MKKAVIIVAGGKGVRMGSDIPKQFMPVNGLPVLMHTIKAFVAYDADMQIILVLPVTQVEYWNKLCNEYKFRPEVLIVHGGNERFHSVRNGLEKITDAQLIGIHDGVRPLVDSDTISKVYDVANELGSCVPVLPLSSSIRKITKEGTVAVNRAEYVAVQTPQCFKTEVLKSAFEQEYRIEFTDDATVVELSGSLISYCEGSKKNIKITTPEDLVFASKFL